MTNFRYLRQTSRQSGSFEFAFFAGKRYTCISYSARSELQWNKKQNWKAHTQTDIYIFRTDRRAINLTRNKNKCEKLLVRICMCERERMRIVAKSWCKFCGSVFAKTNKFKNRQVTSTHLFRARFSSETTKHNKNTIVTAIQRIVHFAVAFCLFFRNKTYR